MTGVRVGELCGIRWCDVYLENGYININNQVIQDKISKKLILSSILKTSTSKRSISIPKILIQNLSFIKRQILPSECDFVVLSRQNTMCNPRNISMEFTKKVAKYQNIKQISIHSLRHTHATLLISNGENIKIIAKIESQEGVDNIDSIIEVTDGVMVARGDMGVEIPIERVPIIQKKIIKKCNTAGKIVITATQMLDSMIRNSLPTRAEASDICNAIFDGTDAIMLSGESASGSFPVEAAETMSRIAIEAEENLEYDHLLNRNIDPTTSSYADAISYSACRTSFVLNAKTIVAATKSGSTARLLSKYRPQCPIIAITPFEEVRRNLALNFGVLPLKCEMFNTTDEILTEAKNKAIEVDFANPGDDIIVAAGMPTTQTGGTNMLKIEKL